MGASPVAADLPAGWVEVDLVTTDYYHEIVVTFSDMYDHHRLHVGQ